MKKDKIAIILAVKINNYINSDFSLLLRELSNLWYKKNIADS